MTLFNPLSQDDYIARLQSGLDKITTAMDLRYWLSNNPGPMTGCPRDFLDNNLRNKLYEMFPDKKQEIDNLMVEILYAYDMPLGLDGIETFRRQTSKRNAAMIPVFGSDWT